MPKNENLGGLSDFGLSQPSESSAVDNPLADLLGNNILDELGRSRMLARQANQLRAGAGDRSFLSRLLSPEGLAPLALGGLAAAAGQPAFGAGLGLGGLQNLQALEEAERTQRIKAVEEVADQQEASLERLDKARNRFIQLLQAQPDMFLTPEGEMTVDARMLGWYATGAPIPLYPSTRRAMDMREEGWKRQSDAMYESLQEAKTKEDARIITTRLFEHHGFASPPPELVESMVNSFGTPDMETQLVDTLMRYGGPSGQDAIIFAGENALPLSHPEVWRRVMFRDPSVTPSQMKNIKYIQLVDEINAWQQDPVNAQQVLQIMQEARGDEATASRAIAGQVLAGRQADLDFYLDEANVPEGLTVALYQRAYSTVASKDRAVDAVRGAQSIPRKRAMTDEEILEERGRNTIRLIEETRDGIAQTQGNRDAVMRNNAAVRIQRELGGGISAVYADVDKIFAAALEDAPRDQNGVVIREAFERLVEQYTNELINQNKE